MTTTVYVAYALTGGAPTALDYIDGTTLADGDVAFVYAGGIAYQYVLDDDSAADESPPDIIAPDAHGGDKRWVLQNTMIGVGAVAAFAMDTPPAGWLECDGAEISRTTYAALFAAIGTTYGAGDGSSTFAVPDLRGEFVRGWDHGRGVDSGRTIGSTQGDDNKSHTHAAGPGWSFQVYTASGSEGVVGGTENLEASPSTAASGGAEARPRNMAMMYCIKF